MASPKAYYTPLRWIGRYILGPALFIWLSFSIYHQVRTQDNLDQTWAAIRHHWTSHGAGGLWVVFILMMVNWGLEARKWQLILRHMQPMGLWHAFKAVLSGVAFALNTPNRIGEYGGRVLYVHEENRWKAIPLTVIGSFSQLVVTILLGAIGLLVMKGDIVRATPGLPSLSIWVNALLYGSLLVGIVCLFLYLRVAGLGEWLARWPGLKGRLKFLDSVNELSVNILLRVLLISLLRYAVFMIQTILLMQLLQVSVTLWQGACATSVMFLVLALIPSVALLDLGLRGEVSILLFGVYSSNVSGIFVASTAIWLINLVIPAALGSLLILGVRLVKEKE